ncbi:MAG: hypothetical protein COW85_06375 [Ignavibacteria bacterium CG22_combo_CG10-13_8_21_14_all_37_15]|nr:hypothetical protein [Ignavibacteria bacterium]OIO15350.1 MAG: hypothetical protein AUJ54_12885 [Ignavibacteria bacterium CG1_02_37_35]PIP77939.1 MAG: hypothetical protein COW85_06375 [Ignavibacteria bacterium CG22_combo_CG10-13_8_21_14_all_37_15]
MKKYFIILTISLLTFAPTEHASDKARGTFLAVGVGPRLPAFDFNSTTMLGYGFNVEIAYTNNEYLPIFLFGKVGFEQFPGAQSFYQTSTYSHFSTSLLPLSFGARYYFSPILQNIVLILPNIEISANLTVFQKLHQFKVSSGKNNFLEEGSKLGFSIGVGASMFLVEMLASYNYLQNNQYLSLDMKVRLPLYVSF